MLGLRQALADLPPPWRQAVVGALALGVPGAIAGLVIGLAVYPPTAWFAVLEGGLPAAAAGAALGLLLGSLRLLPKADVVSRRPCPPGPAGTKPSPSDRYFQDLTYSRAKNAFLLGLFATLCCGLFTGIPAVWIGFAALRDIKVSRGRLRGRGTAIAGIVLGLIGILVSIGAVGHEVR